MSDRVTVTVDAGVADVRLNRPEKRNALDGAMFLALAEAGERLKTRVGLRCVVLSGEGASFCAGLDFASFQEMAGAEEASDGTPHGSDGSAHGSDGSPHGSDGSPHGSDGSEDSPPDGNPGSLEPGRITHLGQQVAWVWQEVPVPVIAAVHGHALGGGIQIALGADIRIVHPDAQLSVREIHWGLVPDMTGTFSLTRLVRPDVAKELTFTGRIVSGVEALELGLATRLSATPREDALAMAAEIAGRSPDAVRGAKALFNRLLDDRAAAQFAEERRVIGSLIGGPNQVESVMANFEKRPPVFTDNPL